MEFADSFETKEYYLMHLKYSPLIINYFKCIYKAKTNHRIVAVVTIRVRSDNFLFHEGHIVDFLLPFFETVGRVLLRHQNHTDIAAKI